MIGISISQSSVDALKEALGSMSRQMPRHLATAINRTAKTVRVQAAKELGKEMNIKGHGIKKAQVLKKVIRQKSKASPDTLSATIGLFPGYPFPLKYFDAKPYVKKTKGKKRYVGITYKPDRAMKGRITVTDAFIVERYGNNVYRRSGATRGPLVRVVGPKPGDYFEQLGLVEKSVAIARRELPKQINRRIREILLARSGAIKLKASKGLDTA